MYDFDLMDGQHPGALPPRSNEQGSLMVQIRIVASTRQEPVPSALRGVEYAANADGLMAAANAHRDYLQAIRRHTDSAARVWVEVDGAAVDAVDLDAIVMADSAAEATREATRVLAHLPAAAQTAD